MSLTNSPIWFGSGATGGGFYNYEIDNSLRFNDNDSAYLNLTPAAAQTNTDKITVSVWVKRANISNNRSTIIFAKSGGAGRIAFESDNTIMANAFETGYNGFKSSAVFRDPSAWYHIVYQGDSTLATAADRNRLWVNGVEQVNSLTSSLTPQNQNSMLLRNGIVNYIGRDTDSTSYNFDGYMSDMNVIDGSIVAPTSFGEAKEGTWIPKSYGGSYGTNGFYLDFSNNSTATDLGLDSSGNSNNWSVNNIATTDQMIDTPTNNFMTFNPLLRVSQGGTFPQTEQGNLRVYNSGYDQYKYIWSTFNIKPNTGKWYFEVLTETGMGGSNEIAGMGLTTVGPNFTPTWSGGTNGPSYAKITWRGNTGVRNLYLDDVSASQTSILVANMAAGDIWQWAMDTDTGKLWVGLNNTWYNGSGGTTGNPSAGTNPTYTFGDNVNELCFMTESQNYGIGSVYYGLNAGQDSSFYGNKTAQGNADANGIGDFYYAPPSGFLALCTANLPEPTIIDGSDAFNTVLYTGNGVQDTTISGVGFQPDWVWIKDRSGANTHVLFDSVRGGTKQLFSNLTNSEQTNTDLTNGFASDGFIVGDNLTGTGATNLNTNTYVSWNWKAGGSAVSNTDGSITSSVSANVDAGFSIVSYTGSGSAATIGHSLGVTPELIIVKNRSNTGGWSWVVYNKINGATKYIYLNGVAGSATYNMWNNTAPTSSVFSVSGYTGTNGSSDNMIAYCFANSDTTKAGSYTGNGSADGPFIYTGFRPAWVMVKSHTAGYDWVMDDAARSPYNESNATLYPNAAYAEYTGGLYGIDFLSNGFKPRTAYGQYNQSGGGYIYLAFAETPFKYANAR